jgi:hypothetical protein
VGALLEDRVAALLRDQPRLTVEEIARRLTARTQTVREILRTGPFEELPRAAYLSDRSKVWRLRSYGADASGRADGATSAATSAGTRTDKQFLLDVLADREPHNLNEILQRSLRERGCGLTVHSRAADLRKDAYIIENWKNGTRGDGSWYRLVATPEEVTATTGDRAAVASSDASTTTHDDACSGEGASGLASPSATAGAVTPPAPAVPLHPEPT